MLKRIGFFILAVVGITACSKQENESPLHGNWVLKTYNISYYDENNQKVFEERPSELNQFERIVMSNTGFNIVKNPTIQSAIKINAEKDKQMPVVSAVTLTSFIARPSYEGIILEWSTASEMNNDYFEIERSNNGAEFLDVDIVYGMGNSNQKRIYQFTDKNPFEGINYYRLKNVNTYGVEEYSDIVAVNSVSLVNNEYPFTRDAEYYRFPIPFYKGKFQRVKITTESNDTMRWESIEENDFYIKDNKEVKVAYSKLLMEFGKL